MTEQYQSIQGISPKSADDSTEISITPPETGRQDSERIFSPEEFALIIQNAKFRQSLETREEGSRLEKMARETLPSDGIPAEAVIRVARDMEGISPEYVKQAITLYFPDKNQMREDLAKFRASLSFEIGKIKFADDLVKELEVKFPQYLFKFKGNLSTGHMGFIYFTKYEPYEGRSFPFFRKVKRTRKKTEILATLNFWSSSEVELTVYDPIFLRACGDKLQDMNSKYLGKKELKVVNTYVV